MALSEVPCVERRLYFPANGKEPALACPIQVTFDVVEDIPTPKIYILPAAGDDTDGKTAEGSSQPSATVQHKMQLSMGQATSTSQFERTCWSGADELDSLGAKAQHACENGWPWSRFRSEQVIVSESENECPGQRTVRVDLNSSQTQRERVQSMVTNTDSTLDLWETKGSPRVYLVVRRGLVIGVLAVEHLLRTHKVRRANATHANLCGSHGLDGCRVATPMSADNTTHRKQSTYSSGSPEAARRASAPAAPAHCSSPPDIICKTVTPDPTSGPAQKTQKQLSLFDTLKTVHNSRLGVPTPQPAACNTTPGTLSASEEEHLASSPLHNSGLAMVALQVSHTPDLETAHSTAATRRSRLAAMVRPSGRVRGSRMARMQAPPTQVLSAPITVPQAAPSSAACQQQQPPAVSSAFMAPAAPQSNALLQVHVTSEAEALKSPLISYVAGCDTPAGVSAARHQHDCERDVRFAVDVDMHNTCSTVVCPGLVSDMAEQHAGIQVKEPAVSAFGMEVHTHDTVCADDLKYCSNTEAATPAIKACERTQHQDAVTAECNAVKSKRMRISGREKPRAVLGVRMLWVARSHRGQGLAEHLLDVARQDVCNVLGEPAARQEVAWASWLVDALEFASQYCEGPEHVLLFNELHSGHKRHHSHT